MIKNLEVKPIEENVIDLNVSFDKEAYKAKREELYKKYAKLVPIKGFRKGRAPQHIFEKNVNKEAYYNEVIQDFTTTKNFSKMLKENNIKPIEVIEAKVVSSDIAKDFEVCFKMVVKPTPTIGEYKGILVSDYSKEVTEEDIENDLKQTAQANTVTYTVEDRQTQVDDIVTVNYEITVEDTGEQIRNEKMFDIVLGKDSFIYNTEKYFMDKNLYDKFSFTIINETGLFREDLKDKSLLVDIEITNIKCKKTPNIDDELAQDVSLCDTLEEYKIEVKEKLEKANNANTRKLMYGEILGNIVENSSCSMPNVMIQRQKQYMYNKFAQQLKSFNMSFESYLDIAKDTVENFENTITQGSQYDLMCELVIDRIVELEKFEVSEERLLQELEETARSRDKTSVQLKAELEEEILDNVTRDIQKEMAVSFLIENSKIIVLDTTEENVEKLFEE